MRIPSLKKLELQAEKYSDNHPVIMPQEWLVEYENTSNQCSKFRNKMRVIQKLCPAEHGGECNCSQHPDFKEIDAEATPHINRYNNLISERANLQQIVFKNELNALLRMRDAKIKYRKERQLALTDADYKSSAN